MSLSSVSIRRPVLSIVMSMVIVLFGVIGFYYLGVREYPAVDPPVITVSTGYIGANADVVESQITEPLEESINGAPGIRSLTSSSQDGRSNISVEFNLDVDLETAANDVRDRVSRAIRSLPPDVDPPVVTKADANSDPIVFLNIQSQTRNLLELTDIARNVFRERLQTIPGVSEIQIWGEKRYSMRLWMDPAKLAAYRLTPLDVRNALLIENVELPSGRIEGHTIELSIRTMGRLETVPDFNNMIVREDNGRVIRFQDIGRAELSPENERFALRRDGIPMIGVVIVPQPGANNIAIVDEFYKRVDQIQKDLPEDITLGIGFDVTRFIRASISEVKETIYIAFGLVVLIIFLFLRDWRSTVIPVLAIPISLVGTFFIIYLAGFSINVLTLLGIVLAIGLVVDDAIVVLENIYSKIEQGMNPIEAALTGSREIFFAVISTTVVLAAVFLPVIFLQGLTGRLFREFGVVVAGSVIISSFVALTLTPMLSSRLLRRHTTPNRLYRLTEPFFNAMTSLYAKSLSWFMKHRSLGLGMMAVSIALIIGIGSVLKSELAPIEDRSSLRIMSTAAEGASFEYMDEYLMRLYDKVDDAYGKEADAIITVTSPRFGGGGVNTGMTRLILSPPDKRALSQQQIAAGLQPLAQSESAARSFIIQEQSIGGSGVRGGLPVQYVIQAPNIEHLKAALPKFMSSAAQRDEFQVVDVNLKFSKPELFVEINRDKARSLGVSVADIGLSLQLALSGQRFGYFIMNGKQYQVIGQFSRENRSDPLDLKNIYVRNAAGDLIQLDNLVHLSEQATPPQLFRFNRYVSATVSAGLAPGRTIGEGISAMDAVAKEVLDERFSTALAGVSKDFSESSSSLLFAFVLALILIYLVLAGQFESFRDPMIILFTVPLALAGALVSLWAFNQTLNVFSQIGIIMLIGLVTKNGILIVEFANQRKEDGLPLAAAIEDAAAARFRPILMTSLSTILGFMPIALALGAGSESRISMGIAVVGGMTFSSFLTLYVVPAMYSYLSKERGGKAYDEMKAIFKRAAAKEAEPV